MKHTVLIILATMLFATSAFAQAPNDAWFNCARNSQCVIVDGTCDFDWAVNKKSVKPVKTFVSQWKTTCPKRGIHDALSIAICENGKCIVGLNQTLSNPSAPNPPSKAPQ